MTAFLILSPFLMAAIAGPCVRRFPNRAAVLAIWPALIAAGLAMQLPAAAGGGRTIVLPWAPSLGLSLSLNIDGLGLLFGLLIAGIGALVMLYASAYMAGDPRAGRFYTTLFAFMGAMLGVVFSDNVLALFVFWELTGFTSFLLIGFDHERAAARAAALQALIVTGGGGLALLAAGVLLIHVSGTADLSAMTGSAAAIAPHPLSAAIAVLLLLAAFTKSAQVPFHFWLPNAMEAPTPVSAYLHSATMVKAGVYLVARMTPLAASIPLWTVTVAVAGAATMVLGAYRSLQETDLKRILAYSTVSALGVLMMLLGVGTRAAIAAALAYLVAHACYKGALFLVAGAIDHETGTRDVDRLGGLRSAMPVTAFAAGAAALSMAGVPLTIGFIAKDGAYEALLQAGGWSFALLALTVLASVLLGVAGLVAGVQPFSGPSDPAELRTSTSPGQPLGAVAAALTPDGGTLAMPAIHEPPWALCWPPLVLAVLGIAAGVAPMLLDTPLSAAAQAVAGSPLDVTLRLWHGFTLPLVLSVLTLAGVGFLYLAYTVVRVRTRKPAFGTEDLYTGTVAALDAISRAIAPPLRSASLRSYVMVIVVTSGVIGGVALIADRTLVSLKPPMGVAAHELLVILVIIAGALAATLARSTMAAVLSLGAVGYGVATTFLSFGAPDLAMTQFSVETLTVLIYVLVFRHFRELGALSPRAVRSRDAIIAGGIGTFIGGLVLLVASTRTAPGLREYFAENGPTLGHGRNIVNVILVDFRGFDTLGEITVLATAAIGVGALLRFAVPDGIFPDVGGVTTSSIFRTAARLLMPLLLLFSVFLLLRGHNQPGGGFVGGLVAAAAFSLYAIAFGVHPARQALLVRPVTLIGAGLLIALASGIPAVLYGQPFLTAQWLPGPVALGTPAVFDTGVFLVVAGVVLNMFFTLAEEP